MRRAPAGVVLSRDVFGQSTFGTEGVEFGVLAITYNDSNRTKLQYRLERRDQSSSSTQHMPTESRGRLLPAARNYRMGPVPGPISFCPTQGY